MDKLGSKLRKATAGWADEVANNARMIEAMLAKYKKPAKAPATKSGRLKKYRKKKRNLGKRRK
jgi:hypothetical protein